jgi:hypothetical protein
VLFHSGGILTRTIWHFRTRENAAIALAWTPAFTGREAIFSGVRDFIALGSERPDGVVVSRVGQILDVLTTGGISQPLKNFIRATEVLNKVVVDVVLLQAGSNSGIGFSVNLTPDYSVAFTVGSRQRSWVYLYWAKRKGRFCGEVRQLP